MLKSLDLYGFKSFADRTRFDFSTGITCVVGPNGSGKSNVVDAIKWILGDQSPKSLRGKEMTDVIFNGSAGRKPSAFAEATLIFDNTTGYLPVDAPEVHIGRRLWRNGDAEYLINRAPARLRDVRELFMGTGTATSAYAIIEQGRVDQILQSNATARRAVFEEAAGISRYKARKVEAFRKLERVDQNLLRLTDIVDEVEAQLNSTRTQASKAAKFREVSAELREQWLGLAADDARHISTKLDTIDDSSSTHRETIENLTASQQQLEEQLNALDVERAEFDDLLRQVEKRGASTRETIASHETTIGHLQGRAEELSGDLSRLMRQRVLLEQRYRRSLTAAGESEQNVAQHLSLVDVQRQEFSTREEELQALRDAVEQTRKRFDELRQKQKAILQQASESDRQIGSLELQKESAAENRQEADKRQDASTAQIESARQSLFEKEAALENSEEKLREAKQQLAEVERRQRDANDELRSVEAILVEQRERRTAWDARRQVLEDLEERQEGVGIGTKEILSRSKTSKYPPWNEVLGSVADLIEADLENAALLDVALGSRAQLIVLRNERPLLDYLESGQSQIAGRVGFVCLNGSVHTVSNGSNVNAVAEVVEPVRFNLDGVPGVIQRADGLATFSPEFTGLVERLLGHTWIVSTLHDAFRLKEEYGKDLRLLTLQGELLESEGRLYVGAVRGDTSLVSRRSELRRLKNDIARLNRKIEQHESQLSGLGSELSEVDGVLERAKLLLAECAETTAQMRGDVAAQRQELERLESDGERISLEIQKRNAQAQQLEDDLQVAIVKKNELAQQREQVVEELELAEAEIDSHSDELQGLEATHAEEKLGLVQQEERLATLQQECRRLEDEVREALEQRDEAEHRYASAKEKLQQTTLRILNTRALLDELWLAEEEIATEIRELLGHRDALRVQRAAIAKEDAQYQRQRREANESLHKQEMEARDLKHKYETLRDRIEEEYQIELAELVEEGISAYQLYLDQNFAKPDSTIEEEELLDEEDILDEELPDEEASAIETVTEEVAGEGGETAAGDSSEEDFEHNDSIEDEFTPANDAETLPTFEEVREEIEARVNRLRRKLKLMGNVNTDSLRSLDELEERYDHMNSQLLDLTEAKETLEGIIRKINHESQRLFVESFEAICVHFRELFRKLFGGGDGDIILEDPEDVLECGIDVVARPPGKELRSISLLSGGEKTLTAVALLLAMFKSRPSPFCVLDEVDAALDEANVERYASVVKAFHDATQFIIITHHKRTMTAADVLYGVTMEQAGVSKRMAVRFEDVSDNGEIRPDENASSVNDAA